MFSAVSLLFGDLVALGISVEVQGDRLRLESPRPIPLELEARLREHKPQLLSLVRDRLGGRWNAAPASATAPWPCYSCDSRNFWRLRSGLPWVCSRCHPPDQPEEELEHHRVPDSVPALGRLRG